METLIPLRALALYAHVSGDAKVKAAAALAAEVFLTRRLYKRRSDGQVINHHFPLLHYPLYWHYRTRRKAPSFSSGYMRRRCEAP